MTFTCLGCGNRCPDDDNGCLTCDTCDTCTPNAGNCLDCADMRQQNTADLYRRHQQETP